MDGCIFCKIIRREMPSFTVWEDEDHFAFLDIQPLHKGHVLLIPKQHIDYIFDYENPLYHKIFDAAKMLSNGIRKMTGAKKVGMAIEGLSVAHLHIHLVPINEINDLDPCLAKPADMKELSVVAEELKKHLE